MTNKKYNFYLAVKDLFVDRGVPLLWCSAKTFYEENSTKVDQWNWANPWFAEDFSVDEILDQCKQNPPHVFGCSVFVWNESLMFELGRRVKEQHPECLVVYGGPQIDIKYSDDYFKNHPWVDVVCPSDGYGEIIIKELLDHYPIKDFEDIPYIYYTNEKREKLFSKKSIEKRSFVWPSNIYKAQEETLKDLKFRYVIYETSRGCPYKCIYCDWGGGTYTKISKKPYTTVLDEIDWLAQHQVHELMLSDANFGIMPIDVDIAEHLAECKRTYGYPQAMAIEVSKNGLKRSRQMLEILAEAKLIPNLKIPLQTTDPEVKKNIERIDVDIKDQLEMAYELRNKFPHLMIRSETILGLPGDTYEKTLDQLDELIPEKLLVMAYPWLLLPEAPAYSPEMREKFKIGTIRKLSNAGALFVHKDNNKERDAGIAGWGPQTDHVTVETVVETYSYSKDEWLDMFLIHAFATAGTPLGLNDHLVDYLKKEHNLKIRDTYDFLFKNFIKTGNFKHPELKKNFENLHSSLHKWMYDPTYNETSIDYHPDFPLLFSPLMFLSFIGSINLHAFYQEICAGLAQHLNDEKIIDLGNYISNGTIDISYNFDTGRQFETKYDWQSYFLNSNTLTEGKYRYIVTDKVVGLTPHECDWHLHDEDSLMRKKQFYYQTTFTRFKSRFSTTIKPI